MGALGNSRRGGRFPPLVIGALIACIFVVGFKYWVSNSRNQELQTKLRDMETRARQAAAEQVAVEQKTKNDFQELLKKQSEHISRIEEQHSGQLEAAKASWRDEKESLLLNISSNMKTIQTMKSQFNTLFENLEKIQKELQECHRNGSILSKKQSDDLAQCNTHVLVLKEECTAKLAAARREAEQMLEKKTSVLPARLQASPGPTNAKTVKATERTTGKTDQDNSRKPSAPDVKENQASKQTKAESEKQPSQLETNGVTEEKDNKVQGKAAQEGVVSTGKKLPQANQSDTKQPEVLDTHGAESKVIEKDADDPTYLGDELNFGESEDNKEAQLMGKEGKRQEVGHFAADLEEEEEEAADYNGNDENEGEFEADKQAELADI